MVSGDPLLWRSGIPWSARGPRSLLFMTLQPAVWLLATILCHRAAARSIKWAEMIKKVKQGYKVLSEKGKNLGGPYNPKTTPRNV
jgi:hypothetical protein